ncbi:MAG: pyridoxine 5'-phosphate synthase [Chitinivibrionales bacterium]|nr:pyridoxine 5'-phosphate synthase [Chitinivibrionales bacterium]MBD3359022.1 pyridoxine 5'-phosphate synthase [Chitinivibrionales bacterium]
MTKLSVNVNKFALLRNSRDGDIPNVLLMAKRCVEAGAHGITVHPRPDERHIRYTDAVEIGAYVDSLSAVEFNIEGNPTPRFLELVHKVKPDQCTLVPDSPEQLTSDHGWDLECEGERLTAVVRELRAAGIRASLFMDPVVERIALAPATGAERIELYTEAYAKAFAGGDYEAVLRRYKEAADFGAAKGLEINAGHDLNLRNLRPFLDALRTVREVSIGHALVVEAFDYGLEETVRRYVDIVTQ